MKKVIAVVLCVVMMVTMIPSFFASAATLPAAPAPAAVAEEIEVVAQNDEPIDDVTMLLQWLVLWFIGPLQLLIDSEFLADLIPALIAALKLSSPGALWDSLVEIWEHLVNS